MKHLAQLAKWLYPGMGVKRWLLVAWLGLVLFTAGIVLYVKLYMAWWFEARLIDPLNHWTGHVVPSWAWYLSLIVLGTLLMVVGIHRWFHVLFTAVAPYSSKRLVDVMYERTTLSHRSNLVAIGGGTGLASLLRGLKAYTSNITAVVTVSDDGGSSGRLRKERGLLPPGDIRNCLVALADHDTLLSELFQYRFSEGGELAGHSFGNIFLAALTDVAEGDFDRAIKLSSRILAIRGKVLPGTLGQAQLCAEFIDGTTCEGESEIPLRRKPIKRVWLDPDCSPLEEVLKTIHEAHAIVLGPGSLYTSVIPNLLVNGVAEALEKAQGLRIYVCNVMTQPGETDGYTASDHLKAIFRHVGGRRIVDVALVNQEVPRLLLDRYSAMGAFPVAADLDEIRALGVRPLATSLISETNLVRHDPTRLAEEVNRLIVEFVECGSDVLGWRSSEHRRKVWKARYARRATTRGTSISSGSSPP